MDEQIATRLREERKRLGYATQAQLAAQLDVSPGSVHNYEAGKRSPDADFLAALGRAGGDLLYILTGVKNSGLAALGTSLTDALAERGIEVSDDHVFGGTCINFSSTGMAWLLNYLHTHKDDAPALSLSLLNELAVFKPDRSLWRELRIKALALPVGDGSEYLAYFFYLDGTPPRQLHMFRPGENRKAEGGVIEYEVTRTQPFRIANDQAVYLRFSEREDASLTAGDLVVVDPLALNEKTASITGAPGEQDCVHRGAISISGGTIGQVVKGDAAGGGKVVVNPEAEDSKKRQ